MPNSEQPELNESDLTKTVTLTEKDLRDAARLFRLLVDPAMLGNGLEESAAAAGRSAGEGGTEDRQSLIGRARALLNSRRARRQYFHRDIFGEPAWEILLALYVTEESGARLTTGKLAEWIEAPLTTVIRWVKALEEEALVGRLAHPTDKRIIFIQLLDKGRKSLDSYFASIA